MKTGESRTRNAPGLFRSTSGQVMVEACIGLALLAFVWLVSSFATYMANNQIRTAMAARHAAWMKGNGGTPTKESFETNFFFCGKNSGLVKVIPKNAKGSIIGLLAGDGESYRKNGNGHWCEVIFGMSKPQAMTTDIVPFSFMKTGVPLMPKSMLEEYLEVKSHCQWANVSETWTDGKTALKELWKMIISEVGAAGRFIKNLF